MTLLFFCTCTKLVSLCGQALRTASYIRIIVMQTSYVGRNAGEGKRGWLIRTSKITSALDHSVRVMSCVVHSAGPLLFGLVSIVEGLVDRHTLRQATIWCLTKHSKPQNVEPISVSEKCWHFLFNDKKLTFNQLGFVDILGILSIYFYIHLFII